MLYVEWFVKRMLKIFKIMISEDEVSYESYLGYRYGTTIIGKADSNNYAL